MRVLAFGTYDARTHPRIAVLIEGLRAHGLSVDECAVPLGLDTAARVAMLRQPWRLPGLLVALLRSWSTLLWRSRRQRPAVVLVGYLGHFDVVLARARFPRSTIVLDQLVFAADTAADRGVSRGPRQRALRTLDRIACAAADIVVVDTEENAALIPGGQESKALVVAVGAPAAWFTAGAGSVRQSPPGRPLRAVFFGLFTPLQGAITIAAAGALLDPQRVTLTMIGSGQQWAAALEAGAAAAPGALEWTSWVDAGALPALVAGYDICLGIMGTTPKALRVCPNKVFQGAAAGCAIVTSDTAPQRRQLGGGAHYVPAGDSVALADALHALADNRPGAIAAADAAHTVALTAFTASAVTEPLVLRLRTVTSGRGGSGADVRFG